MTDTATMPVDELTDHPSRWQRLAKKNPARWAFVAYLVAAIPVLLVVGSPRWFFSDEWSFLSARSASLHDLFAPNNQHWSTIPVLFYKAVYSVVGLHHYWPYQLPVILSHLAIAFLLRHIMRRCGVRPWTASLVAATYVLFGPGVDDILWAFQIGFNLAVLFGLAQMILADHDGALDRRDWLGLGLGGLALMCSGQAPAVILATGFAVWWRRGWRPAVFHTAPLGLAYAVWYVWAGASLNDLLATRARLFVIIPGTDISAHSATVPSLTVGAFGRFMWTTGSSLFQGLGYFTVLAFALVALLIVGVVVAWKSTAPSRRARRFGTSGGLLIGAVVGAAAAAPQRAWSGPDAAAASRYVGVTAAMVLPILAVAADALMLRWRPLIPVVVVLFLLPALGNISLLSADAGLGPGYYRTLETWIGSLPHYRDFDKVPAWVTPNDTVLGTPGVSVGWLRRAEKQGKLPPPQELDPPTLSAVAIQLGVAQRGGAAPPNAVCRTYDKPLALDPRSGDVWRLETPVQVSLRSGNKSAGALTLTPTPSQQLVQVTLPDLKLLLSPPASAKTFVMCS